jgi:voltage-gated potassium channel
MDQKQQVDRERTRLLVQVSRTLEGPMIVLGLIWLVLIILDLVRGERPWLARTNLALWGIFVAEFLLRFFIAPRKLIFLRTNVLSIIALAVPALRVFRIAGAVRLLRVTRVARGTKLVRVLGSLNRGLRILRTTMRRRQLGYVLLSVLLVDVIGAAGMFAFEQDVPGSTLTSYLAALYWTTMLLTTIGSEYWPQTAEGRALCVVLSMFSIGTLGYVTAALASVFIGADALRKEGSPAR